MRKLKVCMYGGTNLDGAPVDFVRILATTILESMPAVIVTGGFWSRGDKQDAISTDRAALDGARAFAKSQDVALSTCFEAWVPASGLDSRLDVGGAIRMTEQLGITIRAMEGRTALGRRLAMVADVDMVATVAGKTHTELVLEQALERGVPALPIPGTGGDSEKVLATYGDRIAAGFAAGEVDRCRELLTPEFISANPSGAAAEVVKVLRTAKVGRCLVLQPYDEERGSLYTSIIEPAVSEHMTPILLKNVAGSREIYATFFDAVSDATAVIADISQLNENVMYEIGYTHGRDLHPLLYTFDLSRLEQLPVYFRTLNVHHVERDQLGPLISGYLLDALARRGPGSKLVSI
jgi:hypothetical protein